MLAAPANTAVPPKGTNQLALVSLLLSFIYPLGLFLVAIDAILRSNFPSASVLDVLNPLSSFFILAGLAGMIAAIVTGHLALGRARMYPPEHARRAMAITGFVLGYVSLGLSVLAFVVYVAVIFVVLMSL